MDSRSKHVWQLAVLNMGDNVGVRQGAPPRRRQTQMEFPLDLIEKFDFGYSNADEDFVDLGYVIRLQGEGMLIVIVINSIKRLNITKVRCREWLGISVRMRRAPVKLERTSFGDIHPFRGQNQGEKEAISWMTCQSSLNANLEAPGK